ncbi:hypothetical protein EA462_05820 [Natrarchaeobius halalkaliphilus]|uniref:Uncharacterized protein n=1 Tax=Natrarchaeobius halalkaliphilus TaxID=1679091 RepID=A0A3N6P1R5_9EURY|nr:hypothetical protein [Natrarchaeobius halalkaliphilus]RQG91479.1 hypothetical protein EA462_05820 [Natrarchaeobius halalkaliphilus]
MGHSYRTEPDPPEEPTERSESDARETTDALRSGAWVAISSIFGLVFLVATLTQLIRVLVPTSPYGGPTLLNWLLFVAVVLAFAVAVTWSWRERTTIPQ